MILLPQIGRNVTTVIETGLPDYHLMTVTCLNKYIKKLPPKITHNRNYKRFDANAFRRDLIENIIFLKEHEITYTNGKNAVKAVLNIHAPFKNQRICGTDKTINKVIL